ncbi:hypothetical protein BT69DRAFT_1321493 [Atractiella rhizophila]|nr:hypothetical protein BT69DRAFT_1321492 [Atractiella rhizophila]KAH8920388.1 hypothetical protein BT69DRAFT_1321493 [Atractiella rhizophila]
MTVRGDLPVPTEILVLILELLWSILRVNDERPTAASKSISPLMLVCKRWKPIVSGILWSELYILDDDYFDWLGQEDDGRFIHTTRVTIKFAPWQLQARSLESAHRFSESTNALLSKTRNLEHLEISFPSGSPGLLLWNVLPRLRVLILRGPLALKWLSRTSLGGVEHLTELKLVNVAHLEEFAFTECSSLRTLELRHCRQKEDAGPLQLPVSLNSFYFHSDEDLDVNTIQSLTSISSSLKVLQLWGTVFQEKVGPTIRLPSFPALERLSLLPMFHRIGALDLFDLAPLISQSLQLRELELCGVSMITATFGTFFPHLELLSIQNGYIHPDLCLPYFRQTLNSLSRLTLEFSLVSNIPAWEANLGILLTPSLVILRIDTSDFRNFWKCDDAIKAINRCTSLRLLYLDVGMQDCHQLFAQLTIPLTFLMASLLDHEMDTLLEDLWASIQRGGLRGLKRARVSVGGRILGREDLEDGPEGLKKWMVDNEVQFDQTLAELPLTKFHRWAQNVMLNL